MERRRIGSRRRRTSNEEPNDDLPTSVIPGISRERTKLSERSSTVRTGDPRRQRTTSDRASKVRERQESTTQLPLVPCERPGSVASVTSDFFGPAISLKIGPLFTEQDQYENSTNYTNDSTVPDLNDPLTLNSLMLQAITDAEGFLILNPDRYTDQKKRLVQIFTKFESLQNKLSLEDKIKEATENVLRVNSETNIQVVEAQKQLIKSDAKMRSISKGFLV